VGFLLQGQGLVNARWPGDFEHQYLKKVITQAPGVVFKLCGLVFQYLFFNTSSFFFALKKDNFEIVPFAVRRLPRGKLEVTNCMAYYGIFTIKYQQYY